ncbi:MAG TPA: ATP-binding protein [Rhizomicrobium sp.]|nr:ATP-binding protein [Rhizomicrobium sp.]
MAFSGFQSGILLRVAGLLATLALLAWMAAHTNWYVTMVICAAAAMTQVVTLARYASRAGREIARFLDAIAFDDTSASFLALSRDRSFGALGTAMGRVLEQVRSGRAEREEQSQYLQNLLAHMPVALISVNERGTVQQLNLAARRLFAGPCDTTAGFARYGQSFATGLEALKPGEAAIVRMDRATGALQLKAAATDVVLGGIRRRLISLQNIEVELNAQELVAWQTVIRVMAHEVMNSLTPISSLAGTARERLEESLAQLPPDAPARAGLEDAREALDTLARRSDGLLHFVQNHRRLTRRMVAQAQIVPMRRTFTRLQRLLADELKPRGIELIARVEPETLEIAVDADLLDQALINLMRNAMDALRDKPAGQIILSAMQDSAGRPLLTVADNGPGIPPEQREKVFVPFYTTKRHGSGVGLTLVRQIAAVHGAAVGISDTPGGGTTVSLRF